MLDRRTFLATLAAVPLAAQSQTIWNVLSFHAHGDGVSDDTPALQRAVDACASGGGGTVLLPGGKTYLCGTVVLRSNITLELAPGATLKATGNRDLFHRYGSLLFAKDAVNVSIRGVGRIDGNFHAYLTQLGEGGYKVTQPFLGPYDPLDPPTSRNPPDGRPRMLLFVNCRNVRLEQFTIFDAPTWTIHPIACDGLYIEGISILNDLRVPNCDGIDVDHCRRVRIANCNIQAGDDCIILKTSRNFTEFGPCEDITVTGCTLTSSSAGIKIEPEGSETIRNATFSSCVISRSNRGICLLNRDGALIEDLIFSNFVISTELRHSMWWGVGEPIHLSNLPRRTGMKTGQVRALRFHDILCTGESGLFIHGWPDSPITDVAFDDIRIAIQKTSRYPGGFYDLRPNENYRGLFQHEIAGVYCRWADDISLRNVAVHWTPNLPAYYGPALEAEGVTNLHLERFTGIGAHATDPAQLIKTAAADSPTARSLPRYPETNG